MTVKKTVYIILCALILFCIFAPFCAAANSIDILLTFEKEVAAENAELKIYKVARITSDGKTKPEKDFEKYGDIIEAFPENLGREAAETVVGYAQYYGCEPYETVYTDKDGKADFTADTTGIYLVVGETYESNGNYIAPVPAFLKISGLENLEVEVKSVSHKIDEKTDFTVKKVWEGVTPTEGITCILLANGKEVDRVVLSEENNWCHTWEKINYSVTYNMIEKDVPEDCYITVERENDTFTLINKGKKNTETEGTTDNKSGGDSDGKSDGESDKRLAQTGLLWWPIPVLTVTGAILTVSGTIVTRFSKSDGDR